MADNHSLLDTLHEATHRVPGVPAHAELPVGHQGIARQDLAAHAQNAGHRPLNRARNHSSARPPRVLVAWQRRIAALFGQDV